MECFIYDWSSEIINNEQIIRIFGLDKNSESVCLNILNFRPHVYVELPENRNWSQGDVALITRALTEARNGFAIMPNPERYEKVMRAKLYNANVNPETLERIKYPHIRYEFKTDEGLRWVSSRVSNGVYVSGIGKIPIKIHENNIPIENQLACTQKLPLSGWIKFDGRLLENDQKHTRCNTEYVVDYRKMCGIESTESISPTILSFDIETNSSNPKVIPNPANPKDCIFQIACVFWKGNEQVDYLISLGQVENLNPNIKLISCENEYELLMSFIRLIEEWNPNAITGYNILGFDVPYLLKRAEFQKISHSFSQLGMIQGKLCDTTELKSTNGILINTQGRLWIDLLYLMKQNYKFSSNKLEFVANHFLQSGKDPITPSDIFFAYREGVVAKSEKGLEMLSRVGNYCVLDSILVKRLFEKLDVWIGQIEMARVCNVRPSTVLIQGQQSKVFAQIVRFCHDNGIVVENRPRAENDENGDYQGALVIDPIPGIYENVVPFDFASLYPSIIVAYNIDYSTLVPTDSEIPDSKCHIIEWNEHVDCEHTLTYDLTSKSFKCENHRYRWLKEPRGVIPTIIQNLLDMRAQTRSQMKKLDKSDSLISVLDKRQLSYKIAANSQYGLYGAQKGMLPLLEGAMSVTAIGRKSLLKASIYLQEEFGSVTIYGDTDSVYSQFPKITDQKELWNYAEYIGNELVRRNIFPKPMRLAFEEKIYADFLILTKKRYMWKELDRNGEISQEIGKKGVLLARRDNAKFVRDIYENIVRLLFEKQPDSALWDEIINHILSAFRHQIKHEDFVITKSVKEESAYKEKLLPADIAKRTKRLTHLGVDISAGNDDKHYRLRTLPAHVQLASKMRSRGVRVDPGQRLEYVVIVNPESDNLFDKIEDMEYHSKFSEWIKLDYLYYVKSLCIPIDQLFKVRFKVDKVFTKQYKIFLNHHKVVDEINQMIQTRIKIK